MTRSLLTGLAAAARAVHPLPSLRRRWVAALTAAGAAATVLVAVGPTTTPAVAAPEDRVTGSWNMQGESDGTDGIPESRWQTGIRGMLNQDGVQVAALQEAGNAPPPSSAWTDRVFPEPGVTEHLWNIGTHDRPDIVNIYWADPGQQRNGLAILSRETARDAVQLPVNSRFNSRPMMGVQFGTDWYFNAHALSNGPNRANDAPDIIETARQFMANRPGENWMVLADFNNNPGRMPAGLQRHVVAANQPTHQGGSELDFAYTNIGNQTTVDAERRGVNSDHYFVRYAINPNCNAPQRAARAAAEEDCNAPVPGETYRFYARHLDNAVLADEDPDGNFQPPTLKRPSGSATEAIQVRFSTEPGRYLLAFNDDWCIARYRGDSDSVTEAPCLPGFDVTQWEFHQGQIFTPGLGAALQPSPNRLGAEMVVSTDLYQWRHEPFVPPGVDNTDPSDPCSGMDDGTSDPPPAQAGGTSDPPPAQAGDTSDPAHCPASPIHRVMIVGDSISNGFEGNHTWRQRLWEWAQSQNWAVTFVGPLTGTKKPDDPHPPVPPTQEKSEETKEPEPDPAEFTGAYAEDAEDGFVNGGSAHYAMWGRQLGQDVGTIKLVMNDLKSKHQLPDLLLVELGFNDIGWLGASADLVDTMKDFVDNARAANPNVKIVLANVPHRTTLGSANPQLPQRTTDYNQALAKAIPTWSTDASPVALADLDGTLGCDPSATTCASTYDGLHPNALGEYRIARVFGTALHDGFGIGSAAPKVPSALPTQPVQTPTGLRFDGTQQGVTVTWPKVFGAHSYDIQWREVTTGTEAEWQDAVPGAQTNRWDLPWQFTNQPHDGHTYEVRVRAVVGDGDDLKSPWSNPVSGVAHPTTAAPPATLHASAGAGSIDVSWTPPTGPHTDTIVGYALWIYDEDTPLVYSRIIGYPPAARTAHVGGLTPGHHYQVFMDTWNAAGEGKPRIADTVIPQ